MKFCAEVACGSGGKRESYPEAHSFCPSPMVRFFGENALTGKSIKLKANVLQKVSEEILIFNNQGVYSWTGKIDYGFQLRVSRHHSSIIRSSELVTSL